MASGPLVIQKSLLKNSFWLLGMSQVSQHMVVWLVLITGLVRSPRNNRNPLADESEK